MAMQIGHVIPSTADDGDSQPSPGFRANSSSVALPVVLSTEPCPANRCRL